MDAAVMHELVTYDHRKGKPILVCTPLRVSNWQRYTAYSCVFFSKEAEQLEEIKCTLGNGEDIILPSRIDRPWCVFRPLGTPDLPGDAVGAIYFITKDAIENIYFVTEEHIHLSNRNKPSELYNNSNAPFYSKQPIELLKYKSIWLEPNVYNKLADTKFLSGIKIAALCFIPFHEGRQLEWVEFYNRVVTDPDSSIEHTWHGVPMHPTQILMWEMCYPALCIPRPKKCVLTQCHTLWGLDAYPKHVPDLTLESKHALEVTIKLTLPQVDKWKLIVAYI